MPSELSLLHEPDRKQVFQYESTDFDVRDVSGSADKDPPEQSLLVADMRRGERLYNGFVSLKDV